MFFDLPKEEQRHWLLKIYLASHITNEHSINILTALTDKMSGAEIEILSEMIKTSIILDKNPKIDEIFAGKATIVRLFSHHSGINLAGHLGGIHFIRPADTRD